MSFMTMKRKGESFSRITQLEELQNKSFYITSGTEPSKNYDSGCLLKTTDSLSLSRTALKALLGKNKCNNQTVETKGLSEDENKDHSDKESLLLPHGAHTSVAYNTNRHACSEPAEPAAHTSGQVGITSEARIFCEPIGIRGSNYKHINNKVNVIASAYMTLTGSLDNDSNNKTIDAQHTRHDNRYDVSHDQLGVHHAHGGDTNTRLGGTVGGANVGEAKSSSHTHESEKGGRGRAGLVGWLTHFANLSGNMVTIYSVDKNIVARTPELTTKIQIPY